MLSHSSIITFTFRLSPEPTLQGKDQKGIDSSLNLSPELFNNTSTTKSTKAVLSIYKGC